MGSGFAFDGKIKDIKEGIDEHELFARGALPNTSLGKQYRNEQQQLRVDRHDIKAIDAPNTTPASRPSQPATTDHHEPNLMRPSVSYVLSRAGHLESNVDHWMDNDSTNHRDEFRQPLREDAGVQQSGVSYQSSGTMASFWNMLALLQMMGAHGQRWCNPRTSIIAMLNCVDLFATYVKQVVARMRAQVANVALEQMFNEFFTVGMDIALTLHALVFLVLSVYQASNVSC